MRGCPEALRLKAAFALLVIACVAPLLIACGYEDPRFCADVQAGTYRIDVLERWDESSQLVAPDPGYGNSTSCGDGLDISAGSVLNIQTTGMVQFGDCIGWHATLLNPFYHDGGVPNPYSRRDIELAGSLFVNAECLGAWYGIIRVNGFYPPSVDRPPPAVLTRYFYPTLVTQQCSVNELCRDQFAVQMSPIP